jgi:ferredoxin
MSKEHSDIVAKDRRKFFNKFSLRENEKARKNLRLIQNSGCLACGVCVSCCEKQALYFEDSGEEQIKWWHGDSCNRCGNCVNGCPDSLLILKSRKNCEDNQPVKFKLMMYRPVKCKSCGTIIREEEGPVCITCQRRGGFYNNASSPVAN